jgi:hypothetical protein
MITWSEWQDLNLRPLRPERSERFLSRCFFLLCHVYPSRFVHGRFTQFVAISLRAYFEERQSLAIDLGSGHAVACVPTTKKRLIVANDRDACVDVFERPSSSYTLEFRHPHPRSVG